MEMNVHTAFRNLLCRLCMCQPSLTALASTGGILESPAKIVAALYVSEECECMWDGRLEHEHRYPPRKHNAIGK